MAGGGGATGGRSARDATIVRCGPLEVRGLTPADFPTLSRWLSDPRVLEFYEGRDRPHTAQMVREHFGAEDGVTRCMVGHAGRDIGYLQFHRADDDCGYGADVTVYGMDQFIREPDCWNRGIGTRLVGTVSRWLIAERGAHCVVVDPQTWNARAIRCYEKCGFAKVRLLPRHEWHEGALRDCWLMELRAAAEEPPALPST